MVNGKVIEYEIRLKYEIKYITQSHHEKGFSLIAQLVKNPLAMQETRVQFLGWEDLLEKG